MNQPLNVVKCIKLLIHHYLGDNIQDLLVASAAARGAVGNLLHVLKGGQYAVEALMRIKCVCYVVVAYLHTMAYRIIFLHLIYLRNLELSAIIYYLKYLARSPSNALP